MAFDIVIQEGFFVVNDTATIEYIRRPRADVRFTVNNSTYNFFNKTPTIDGTSNNGILGGENKDFAYADLGTVTENGVIIPIADEAALSTYLSGKISINLVSNIDGDIETLDHRIIVTQLNASITIGGVINSTKEYFLDGIIDCSGFSIEVPSGGINISGYNFNLSKLTCADNSYTLFGSPVGGSGDILFTDFAIEVTGTSSKVYDIQDVSGLHSIEISRINFNGCTSLGVLDNYRQGLETGTGRFGGTPELELKGVWVGGYFIDTSIVRSLTDGVYSLYKAGVGFLMSSRFRSNQNIDLPASASFFDFAPANFVNPSTVQITNALISRNGAFDASDSNLTPNLAASDLVSSWINNKGITNTFEGGVIGVTSEITTTISTVNVFVDLAGTFTASGLQHFDSPANGHLRHLGDSPIEYKVSFFGVIEGGQDDEIEIKIVVWDDSASVFVDYKTILRVIDRLQGGRDVAYFNFTDNIILDKDDYVKSMVANTTDTTNVTAELDSELIVEPR